MSDNAKLFWDIDPFLLAGAVELEEFRIRATDLGLQEMSTLLAAIGPSTTLRVLDLAWNNQLRYVEPDLLGRAVGWLEEVNISHVHYRKPQLYELFTAIARPTRLKTLKMGNNDMLTLFGWSFEADSFSTKMMIMKNRLKVVRRKKVLGIVPLKTIFLASWCRHFTINIEANRLTISVDNRPSTN